MENRSGSRSIKRGQHKSVLVRVAKAFEDMKSSSLGDQRDHVTLEFKLWWLRFRALMATKGYASPDTLRASREAVRLFPLTNLGWEDEYPVLYLNWLCEATLGGHSTARITAEQILERAKRETQPRVPVFVALKTLGVSKFFAGEFLEAEPNFQEAVRLYEVDPTSTGRARRYGYELGAGIYAYHCFNQWFLGDLDGADTSGRDLLSFRTENTYTQTVIFAWHAQYQASRRDWTAVLTCCDETKDQGDNFPMLSPLIKIMRSGAEGALSGYKDEHIVAMREGLRSYQTTGARFRATIFQTFLADALASLGRHDECVRELNAIEQLMKSTGELVYQAEVQRIRGEILSARGDRRAKRYLAKAISIANQQSASRTRASRNRELDEAWWIWQTGHLSRETFRFACTNGK